MENQIIQVLEELKRELPMDVWSFRKLIEEKIQCEFWYDEVAEPRKVYNVTKNINIYVYEKEYVDFECGEQRTTIELKNTIYVDNIKTNNIVLVHYDL